MVDGIYTCTKFLHKLDLTGGYDTWNIFSLASTSIHLSSTLIPFISWNPGVSQLFAQRTSQPQVFTHLYANSTNVGATQLKFLVLVR